MEGRGPCRCVSISELIALMNNILVHCTLTFNSLIELEIQSEVVGFSRKNYQQLPGMGLCVCVCVCMCMKKAMMHH